MRNDDSRAVSSGEKRPGAIDWATVELPDAWPDALNWKNPLTVWGFWRRVLSRQRGPVLLPAGLPGAQSIPKYVLQEFHNLPNGNYSKGVSRGYSWGFDLAMLGCMKAGRQRLAQSLCGAERALDIGCGAGHMAAALQSAGIPEVWGLDPSPYLLQRAARRYPGIPWQQGVAESSGLPGASFDAISACFVFHEIPPRYLPQVLAELRRILRPGGRLALLEPSAVQVSTPVFRLWRRFGWRGLYFKWLASHAFEPFVAAWHAQNVPALLAAQGFTVLKDETGCPFRFVLAELPALGEAVGQA